MKNFWSLLLCAALLSWNTANADDNMNKGKIVHLNPEQLNNAELFAVQDYPFMKVIGGDNPTTGGVTGFASGDGKLGVGLYRYSQVSLRISGWPADEFMYFLEGQVEITNEDGSSKIYGPGDAIVMPKGFKGTWRQLSPIRKIAVSYTDDP